MTMTTLITLKLLLVSIYLLFLQKAQAAYVLADDYSGETFFNLFEFFTDPDPTNGHVQFQSMSQANATGLAGFMDGGNATKAVYMGVDTTSEAPNGRGALRVQSKKTYQHALVIADIVHMPAVCGTWPAFWMTGQDWPNDGEIDIVEGVNDQASNQMTLHTSAGASISNSFAGANTNNEPNAGADTTAAFRPHSRLFTGDVVTSNCDVNAPDQSKNAGCAIADNTNLTFGTDFNANGGGVYATEWTSDFIKIWFFSRGSFPADIASASPNPSDNWGPPNSLFQGDFKIDDHFKNLQIVFDTTFCGDWAGNTWNTSSCATLAPTCEEYVTKNAAAFAEAYWAVNTLQVFQDNGTGASENGTTGAGTTATGTINGKFVKSAVLSHLSNQQQDAQGKWVQPQGGWGHRRRSGGSLLGRR